MKIIIALALAAFAASKDCYSFIGPVDGDEDS